MDGQRGYGSSLPLEYPVVDQQPRGAGFMQRPNAMPGCPPGLEYLTQLDQVLVHQKVEIVEAFTDIETKNKYSVKNSFGQQCYFAHEESSFCMRQCCGSDRGFVLHIDDNFGQVYHRSCLITTFNHSHWCGECYLFSSAVYKRNWIISHSIRQEVIRAVRPFLCCGGCCWCANADCCGFTLEVQSPVGTHIGTIRQAQSCWSSYFSISDAYGQEQFTIAGPCCPCSGPCCTADVPFDVFTTSSSAQPIGCIARQYGGLGKEMFTKATNFSLKFPTDLDVKMKALLLSATFLIDMMYFEYDGN